MLNESMLTNINFDILDIFCTALILCKLRKAKKRACKYKRDSSFLTLLVAACDANLRPLAQRHDEATFHNTSQLNRHNTHY